MARHVLEVNSASIVLTGSFNPAIFQQSYDPIEVFFIQCNGTRRLVRFYGMKVLTYFGIL